MSIEPYATRSGERRYLVRLRDASGKVYSRTFRTKKEAVTFESREKADRSRGRWVDPRSGAVTLRDFAAIRMLRPDLRPRTRELYEGLLRLHILPTLGDVELRALSPTEIRAWNAALTAAAHPGPSTVAKAYRLLRSMLATAVQDELIHRNPCVLKAAGAEYADERPVATVQQVYELADLVPRRFRALVLLAAFGGLRKGELFGLQRQDLDLDVGRVSVSRQQQQLKNGALIEGSPKTRAGVRAFRLPRPLVAELCTHLETWVPIDGTALVFTGVKGGPLRAHVWQKQWVKARRSAGLDHLHFHDLRHTGNTLSAATGASTKELMQRMGHASSEAALRYQHATPHRDLVIAAALSDLIEAPTEPENGSEQG